jgi:hypothetical protein
VVRLDLSETEIEAYRCTVEEARNIGMSDDAIANYLYQEWMTQKEHGRLLKTLSVASTHPPRLGRESTRYTSAHRKGTRQSLSNSPSFMFGYCSFPCKRASLALPILEAYHGGPVRSLSFPHLISKLGDIQQNLMTQRRAALISNNIFPTLRPFSVNE